MKLLELRQKTKKISRIVSILLFFLIALFALYSSFMKFSNSKISEISQQITDSIKEKYGIDVKLENIRIRFSPLITNSEIHLKKGEISHSGEKFAEINDCAASGFGSILFSDTKKISLKCGNTVFYADNYRKILNFFNKIKSEEDSGNKDAEKNGKTGKSFSFSTDAEVLFKGNSFKYEVESEISHESGRIFLQESEDEGIIEINFYPALKKALVRLDGMDLNRYREIIKNKTTLDIPEGSANAVIIANKENRTITFENDISIKNLSFFHPVIDSNPFTIPMFRFSGEIIANMDEKTVSIQDSEVSLGGIDAVFSGSYSKKSKEFSIETKSATLNKLETLIHDETFANYLFGGNLELFVAYSKKDEEEPLFSVSGNLVDPKQLSDRLDYLKGTFEYTFTNNDGTKRSIVVGESNPDFTPITLIPEHLIWAVVVSEDAGFFVHKGVDFQELDAAVKDNIKNHKMRGGSTITQQLAKNLFLNRDKTLLRKFREVLLAIELDATLSKERLLEIYLNIIEWAPGIFGISQAARYYFGKEPPELTPMESAYLASVIPGPSKYHYQFLTKNISENWYKNLVRILTIMNETGHLSAEECIRALGQTLVFREKEESLQNSNPETPNH